MKRFRFLWLMSLSACVFALTMVNVAAQDTPTADIPDDEGGPVVITGTGTYTFFGIPLIYDEPVVSLIDMAGWIDRDLDWTPGLEGQIIGLLTSDFFESPFTYTVQLPVVPGAEFRDVDNDGESDTGVQVFSLDVSQNFINDSYIERIEVGANVITSVRTQIVFPEITGGTVLVYAPDDTQGFPSGFGDDGLLFTADDPIVTLPDGYTIVNMDSEAFTFSRARDGVIDSFEIELAAEVDFSDQSYVDAFNSLIDLMIERYSYTEYRDLDWEVIRADYLPRVEALDASPADYFILLTELAEFIGDAHVAADVDPDVFPEDQIQAVAFNYLLPIASSVGLAIAETDDGKIVVSEIAPDGPAIGTDLVFGSEIVSVNGQPIEERIADAPLWPNFPGTDATRRLVRIGNAMLFGFGETVEVAFITPDGTEGTVNLASGEYDIEIGLAALLNQAPMPEMAVSYEMIDGFGYVEVPGFSRTGVSLTIWEDFVRQMNEFEIPGVIIDMRGNGGGSGGMADIMTAYFFSEDAPLIDSSEVFVYDTELEAIVQAPESDFEVYAPTPDEVYGGDVVILVDQNCASACEFFTYAMQASGRATVVGQHATVGAGGAVNRLLMPDGIVFTYTYTRVLTEVGGDPTIEGIGVIPDVKVPVTLETLQAERDGEDPVLDAAIAELEAR